MSCGDRASPLTPAAKDAMEIVLADAKERAARIDDPETANFIPKNLAIVERKAIGVPLSKALGGSLSQAFGDRQRARRHASERSG